MYIELNLTMRLLYALMSQNILSFIDSQPTHPTKFIINHKAERIRDIRLIGDMTKTVFTCDVQAFLKARSETCHKRWMGTVDLEKLHLFLLIVQDWILLDNLNFKNRVCTIDNSVKLYLECLNLLGGQRHIGLDYMNIEVGGKVVYMSANRVSLSIHSENADDWLICFYFLLMLAYFMRVSIPLGWNTVVININLHKFDLISARVQVSARWPTDTILPR